MNVRLVCSALMIGIALAFMTPSGRLLAQTTETKASTPSGNPNVAATKHTHRYWRHRGGKHPHYGSRRLRNPGS